MNVARLSVKLRNGEALPVEKSYKKMRLIYPENVCFKGPEMRVVLENQKAK